MLAEGKTMDQALSALRSAGATILDCIASVRSFRRCQIDEAKRVVESSLAWADVQRRTEASWLELDKEGRYGS
jgi:hypothetical protein